MTIYLPIAEISVHMLVLLGIGGGVGLLSGLFGIGGGFLLTPLLILIGIPPAVAVATGANHIAATSFSGLLPHLRRRTVDVKMGMVLLAGGLVGSVAGVQVFALLRALGQVELFVSLCYVALLGSVGTLMLVESLQALRGTAKPRSRPRGRGWMQTLPWAMRFADSNLTISVLPPLVIGALVGFLGAIMGVGGGFVMVPAMIYLLGMATTVVIGTSMFQILFVAAATTVMHAVTNQTVDAVLALFLLVGGVFGAQVGVRLAPRLRAEQLRVLLALLVLTVCLKLGIDLVRPPAEPFSIGERL